MYLSGIKQASRCPVSVFALIMVFGWSCVQTFSQADEIDARVWARVDGFWKAMAAGDYSTATAFIAPESRDLFMHRIPKSPVQKWKIEKLAFNKERTECDSTTIVTKPVPGFGNVVDWPMQNKWVLSDGEWFLKIPWKEGENPYLEMFKAEQQSSTSTASVRPSPRRPPSREPGRPPDASAVQRLVPDPANASILHSGEKTVFRYSYQNKGSQPIRILSVNSDCHCTSVRKEYPEIAPGDTGAFEVTLDTFGLPAGPLQKEVLVQFSDLPSPIVLQIRAENLPNFTIKPEKILFGAISVGRQSERVAALVNQSGKEIKIIALSNSDPNLAVEIGTKQMKPGEETEIRFRYTPRKTGEFADIILIRTDLEAEPIINVRVAGLATP